MAHKESGADVESAAETSLYNDSVKHLAWRGVSIVVKDRETKQPRVIVGGSHGIVRAGQVCALMGPSGCGKTTLLNVLAGRPTNAAKVDAEVLVNGCRVSRADFRRLSCFVEQEDALIGSLTVRETLDFSARLAGSSNAPERRRRISTLLRALGLAEQAGALIGTPIRRGLSGGQKRRVGVASQLMTSPKMLFLDEPTSGLDSVASWEVINYLGAVARRNKLIVVCSIHQPSTATFNLFDQLVLLSAGRTHYAGPVDGVVAHFAGLGEQVPRHINPAEFLLQVVSVDFFRNRAAAAGRLDRLREAWEASPLHRRGCDDVADVARAGANGGGPALPALELAAPRPGVASLVATLLHRSFIKSYRDVVAYGIRLAMYLGLAVMMGTVWLRLDPTQSSIQPLINAIFFGSAFMSFMAVAYVPAFLEDRMQFAKERDNGLYGAAAFVVSNFIMGVPYLFAMTLLFSLVSYWLSNFQPTATAFFTWVLWLFLDLLAAESLVVFMASLFPSFVVSLALVAFANGLWMSVGGFMVPPTMLNAFYKYAFHYWDYQKYVFQGMMVNEFAARVYSCGEGCRCMYSSPVADQCEIAGQAVLDEYGYAAGGLGRNVGIMVAIIAGYRLAAWVVLKLRP